ncbi:IS1182 family transposase ISOih1 [Streptomyces afghaniensis]
MFKPKKESQNEAEFVFIEDLVPQGLSSRRKVDKYIDFSFIGEKVPSIQMGVLHPIMLFKIMFIGYFYGIRSERQLEREVQMNVAYRWFLGLKLHDPVPDH